MIKPSPNRDEAIQYLFQNKSDCSHEELMDADGYTQMIIPLMKDARWQRSPCMGSGGHGDRTDYGLQVVPALALNPLAPS